MECKDSLPYAVRRDKEGINRNIVECKVVELLRRFCFAYRINRNIVECKGRKQDKKGRAGLVLIETSWNVKVELQIERFFDSLVLIETSWNVKSEHLSLRQQQVPY